MPPFIRRYRRATSRWTDGLDAGIDDMADVYTPPPPAPSGLVPMEFPALHHIWGGNEVQALQQGWDMISSFGIRNWGTSPTSITDLRAQYNNPWCMVFVNPCPGENGGWLSTATFPNWGGYAERRAHHVTYGGSFWSQPAGSMHATQAWPGANDTLEPFPQGQIRGFRTGLNPSPNEGTGDMGVWQQDGIPGYALYRNSRSSVGGDTADFIAKSYFYCWKYNEMAQRGANGLWSDNLWDGNLLTAGWLYGSRWPPASGATAADWTAGMHILGQWLKDRGVPVMAGNVVWRTNNATTRSLFRGAIVETLETYTGWGFWQGAYRKQANPSLFQTMLNDTEPWRNAGGVDNTWLGIMHQCDTNDPAVMQWGIACATVACGAYNPYNPTQVHSTLVRPAEHQQNRRRLGKPVGAYTRSGNTFSRQFQYGTVSVNFDTWGSSFTYTR